MRSNFEDRYFKNARKNNDRLRGYFDDDDDDADQNQIAHRDASVNRAESPEEDPLDAFM
jgi:hypothetical protein